MNAERNGAGAGDVVPDAPLEDILWRHPEWWTLALSAFAWTLFLAQALSGSADARGGHPHGEIAAGVVGQMRMNPAVAWLADWLMMVAAMMLPLVVGPIRLTAARSLWGRRHRAIGGFLVGYGWAWLLAGGAVWLVSSALRPDEWLSSRGAVAVGFTFATFWQLTETKQRALRGCHRTMPLAPAGWRADRDCVRYGWTVGRSCAISCGALMAACSLAGHALPAVASTGAIALAERYVVKADQWFAGRLLVTGALACIAGASF